jgi:diacylglycerol kinase family enzyme
MRTRFGSRAPRTVGTGVVLRASVIVGGLVATGALGSLRPRREGRRHVATDWHDAPRPAHPVLLVNPKSGGEKAERFGLVDACTSRGIDTVVLGRDDDLRSLAEAAVERGADVIGMAGGDGSLGIVASVAATRGIPFVCVPAGTRNHFARDLGLDRADPVGALDAFGPAREGTVDLATVNGRTFVNNVSLGLYGTMVASEDYRAEKLKTAAETMQEHLGPSAPPYDLHAEGPDGPIDDPQVIEVSNNPYLLRSLTTFGTRARMDSGTLGVVAVRVGDADDLEHLLAMERERRFGSFPGLHSWTVSELEVRSSSPVAAGVDGESCRLTPPLHFRTVPGALRVRVP